MPLQVHSSIDLSILVWTGMYWYVHARLGTSRYVQVCAGMYWHRPTCQSHIQVCTSTHNHLLVWDSMYWYVLVCTSMYQHLLWFPIHQFRPSPLLDTWRYMEVHGSTRKSCIPDLRRYIKVHGSTKPCTLMYLDLPWSTAIIQVYRTFLYCHVLPCTSMYRVTGKDGIGELEIRVNAGTY